MVSAGTTAGLLFKKGLLEDESFSEGDEIAAEDGATTGLFSPLTLTSAKMSAGISVEEEDCFLEEKNPILFLIYPVKCEFYSLTPSAYFTG